FKLLDRVTLEERMTERLNNTSTFQNLLYNPYDRSGGYNPPPPQAYKTVGHLIVLPVAHMVFGIDPVNKKVLWEKNLYGSGTPQINPNNPMIIDPHDNTLNILYTDGWIQRLGQAGPVEASYVCVQTREGMVVLEPVSGRTLWTRSDVSPRSHVFGDAEHI